jgi:hypothetical protein
MVDVALCGCLCSTFMLLTTQFGSIRSAFKTPLIECHCFPCADVGQTFPAGVEKLESALQAVYHIMGPHNMAAADAHQLLAKVTLLHVCALFKIFTTESTSARLCFVSHVNLNVALL